MLNLEATEINVIYLSTAAFSHSGAKLRFKATGTVAASKYGVATHARRVSSYRG